MATKQTRAKVKNASYRWYGRLFENHHKIFVMSLIMVLAPMTRLHAASSEYPVIEKTINVGETITIDGSEFKKYGFSGCPGGYRIDDKAFSIKTNKWQRTPSSSSSLPGYWYSYELTALKRGTFEISVYVASFDRINATIKSDWVYYRIHVLDVISIELPSSLGLNVGETSKLNAIVTDNGANYSLSWSSSNANVATVDSYGIVTGKRDGNATITCIATNAISESQVSKSCQVTVSSIKVSNIILNTSSLTLECGEKKQLTATVLPDDATNKNITWSSSNSSVVSVSSTGLVSGVTYGTSTITCTANDGSDVKATCNVVVSPSAPLPIGSEFTNNNIKYEVIGDGMVSIKNGRSVKGYVNISGIVRHEGLDYTIKEIGSSAFDDCTGLTSVTIPNSVTSIGNCAFRSCSGLTSVIIPSSVTSIGSCAFQLCTSLTSVTIPNSVTSIADYTFSGCSGLTSVTIPSTIKSIGSAAFYSCTSLGTFTIPQNVTSIGSLAFIGCSSLTSITIPNNVTSIGERAFKSCTGLTSVTIGSGVTEIGVEAFDGCNGLTSVSLNCQKIGSWFTSSNIKNLTIGSGVTEIGNYAFFECMSLTSVTMLNGVTSIGNSAFSECRGMTAITIPNSVESIGSSAFSYCGSLTAVTIGNSVTSIGSSAFSPCGGLTSIKVESGNSIYDSRDNCNAIIETKSNTLILGCKNTFIPSSVTSISSSAFSGCSGLTSMTIPNSVTSIEEYAFYNCSGLTSVTIGNNVTSIGSSAFRYCSGLTDFYSNVEDVPNTGSDVFTQSSIGNATLHVKKGSLDAYKAVEPWKSFNEIVEDSESSELNVGDFFESSIDDTWCKFEVTDGHNVTLRSSLLTGNVVIPPTVTYSGVEYTITGIEGAETSNPDKPNLTAFIDKTGITGVVIPNTVTRIGACAFDGCENIASITIGTNVQDIGFKAFYDCKSLSSITWGTSLKIIEERAFYNIQLAAVTIPDGVEEIGWKAFFSKTLADVTLPTSIKKLSYGAFSCAQTRDINVNITDLMAFNYIEVVTGEYDNGLCFDFYRLFQNGTEVTNLSIPNTITKMGHIFSGCVSIQSLTIHEDVLEIANCAFWGCSNITKVVSLSDTPVIISGTIRFDNEILETATLYVPSGRTTTYKNAGWNFTNIVEMSALNDGDTFEATVGETTFKVKVLSTADKTCQIGADKTGANGSMVGSDAIVSGGKNWDGVIPSKVTGSDGQEYTVIGIGNRAFKEYSGITSIILPEALEYISEGAFMRMEDLMYVTIPAGVKTVGSFVFNGQESLTEVVSLIEYTNAINSIALDCAGAYGKANKATLVVPAGMKATYQNADGWNHFPRIVEMKQGDANGDDNLGQEDVEIAKDFIMTHQNPDGFVRHNADTNGDNKVNVVDIVNIVNLINKP